MHEKEFKAKRQQPLLAVYSQSGVRSFYLGSAGAAAFLFSGSKLLTHPWCGEAKGAPVLGWNQ